MELITQINTEEIKKNIKTNKGLMELIEDRVKNFIKLTLETILNIEFETKREGLKIKKSWQRNGYYQRSLLTSYGLIENLKVPRYRGVRFHNLIFRPWQRRWRDVEETIIKLFIQGESYRDIRRMVGHLYGDNTMSISTINKISNTLMQAAEEFHQRKIQKSYSIIWIDGIYFPLKGTNGLQKTQKGKNFCVLVALGLDKQTGKKEVIDFMTARSENQWTYERFITSLINRGLQTNAIDVIVHDGDLAIKNALDKIFGDKVKQQDCIFHKLQNIKNVISNKEKKSEILSDASKVFKSLSYQEYLTRRKEFINKYKNKETEVVRVFKNDELIKTKFSLDVQLYHLINTTTPIVGIHPFGKRMFREVRRRTNIIGCFENKSSLNKILFFVFDFINQLLGNASFNDILAFTQF